jgi:hypothetical protein
VNEDDFPGFDRVGYQYIIRRPRGRTWEARLEISAVINFLEVLMTQQVPPDEVDIEITNNEWLEREQCEWFRESLVL